MPYETPIDKQVKNIHRREPLASPPNTAPNTLPLLPWEIEFVEWLAHQEKRPKIADQVDKCEELTQKSYSAHRLRGLKARLAFREFFAEMQMDTLKRARKKVERRTPEYVDGHYEGFKMARDHGDYRALTQYTVPILDRVWPKKEETAAIAAVKIELTTKQTELIEAEIPEIEVTVIDDDA